MLYNVVLVSIAKKKKKNQLYTDIYPLPFGLFLHLKVTEKTYIFVKSIVRVV